MRRLFGFLIFLASLPSAIADGSMPEYNMKAAFLYNFALFTEWPKPIEGQFNLCALGYGPFDVALAEIDDKLIKGARISVQRITSLANVKGCQMLYFGETERNSAHKIVDELGDFPILTVTDADDQAKSGIMIGMRLVDKHLTFEVNNEAVHRAHLTVSSKMLWLARKVY